jgi:nucleoside-diphosphate-sugar epimerase
MDLTGTRVGVTGAGGFIGGRLCERLTAAGAVVVGLEVSPAGAEAAAAAGAEPRPADVTDADAVRSALSDCRLIVHAAARVSEWGAMAEFVRVNVGGTRNVMDAAEAAGANRVVHLSSVGAFGFDLQHDAGEDAWPRVSGSPYFDTKATSERLARRRGATVVRPGDVYGPGSGQWSIRPLAALRSRRLFLPRGHRGLITPVYVDDLVDCLIRALTTPGVDGRAYTAWDGRAVTAREFMGHYARMLGRDGVPSLPAPALWLAAIAGEGAAHATGRPPQVTRAALRWISRRAAYSNARAREDLGWEPRITLEEGMRRTHAWFREAGMLPR